ncbi:hypothetical protein DFJ63DRAFT_334008 [Scheffersomyces coipomensis]|uniref:uncharacterized protein n=1 Tax=Scheffersomyces coipomensis TaxID=1788519 RepID=UPI00315C5A0D
MENSHTYKPSNIVSIFLTKFDVKEGYKLVWHKSNQSSFNFDGLDYKILPSSIQNLDKSNILISHYSGGELYYGLGCYRQIILNQSSNQSSGNGHSIDRNDVQMYSLGILCDPKVKSNGSWKPNEFINNGWEYIDILDSTLLNYLHNQSGDDDFDIFDKLYDKLVIHSTSLFSNSSLISSNSVNHPSSSSSNSLIVPNINHHLLTKLPDLFQTLGPLIFIIYKQALLRKRIVVFNQLHKQAGYEEDDDEEDHEDEDDQNYIINSFNYLISLLSIIPQDIKPISKGDKDNYYSQPIYNIGLNDLNRSKSSKDNDKEKHLLDLKAIVASTNDDILLYQKNLYDIGIIINRNIDDNVWVFKYDDINGGDSSNTNKRIKATLKDYQRFKLIYRELFNVKKSDVPEHEDEEVNHDIVEPINHTHRSHSTSSKLFPKNKIFTNLTNMSTDDLNSIMTNNSTTSGPHTAITPKTTDDDVIIGDITANIELHNYNDLKLDIEPEWWLKYGTESISWRESIWSAFSWFATAGQVNDSEDNLKQGQDVDKTGGNKNKKVVIKPDHIDLMKLIQIIGYFHKLTKKWFYLVDEIVMDQFEQLKDFNHTAESHLNIIDQEPSANDSEDPLLDGNNNNDDVKIVIELTYQDIVEMELDPYSENDLQFVKDFVLLYWGSKVERVDIGIGITSICC